MAYGNPLKLYVLELPDGTIKAGITSRPAVRLNEHSRAGTILRHFVTDQFVINVTAEAELLRRIARIGTLIRGREWFSGVRFSEAKQLAQQTARKFVNTEPVSKAHLVRKSFAKLSFSADDLLILDAYCDRFGLERSVACRQLALAAVVDVLGGRHAKNFAPSAT